MRQSAAEIDYAYLTWRRATSPSTARRTRPCRPIADAVGYSKPGLLHRFGSKEALYRAVMDEVKETVDVIVDHVVSLQEHPEHLEGVMELPYACARPPGHRPDGARRVRDPEA